VLPVSGPYTAVIPLTASPFVWKANPGPDLYYTCLNVSEPTLIVAPTGATITDIALIGSYTAYSLAGDPYTGALYLLVFTKAAYLAMVASAVYDEGVDSVPVPTSVIQLVAGAGIPTLAPAAGSLTGAAPVTSSLPPATKASPLYAIIAARMSTALPLGYVVMTVTAEIVITGVV
jgi:hypothetical protein